MKKLEKLIQIDGRLDEISDNTKLSKEELDKVQDKSGEIVENWQDKLERWSKPENENVENLLLSSSLPDEMKVEILNNLDEFELYQLLNDGLEKALFMQFMISEVHPFDDGNGRLSRIMMNAELVKVAQYKIIIPSVCRDNYLNGLRLASRDNNFRTFCKTIDQAQAYTASINWLDYGDAREKIEADCANLTSDEGLPFFNRVLRTLILSEFAP